MGNAQNFATIRSNSTRCSEMNPVHPNVITHHGELVPAPHEHHARAFDLGNCFPLVPILNAAVERPVRRVRVRFRDRERLLVLPSEGRPSTESQRSQPLCS